MKLRIRGFQSKETLKIQVPNSCTLPQLRQILSATLPDSPFPASIRLSLNRKDDLQSGGTESLQSIGIAAGDLIYFSVDNPNPQTMLPQETDSSPTPPSNDSKRSTILNPQNTLPEVGDSDSLMFNSHQVETLGSSSQMEVKAASNMEGDYADDENNRNIEVVDSFYVPGFLRKMFAAELGEDPGRGHKLIVIAVHAVLLESGFVAFDNDAGVVVDGFQLRNRWPSGPFCVYLFYTLRNAATKTVALNFRSLGKYIYVYGTLRNGSEKRGTHHVQLNEDELVPVLNVVWANCGGDGHGEESYSTSAEKEVFKFWRMVKDNLALPLLIDLCDESDLELPPCFMRLPTELKLKILESLPGVDVAKVSCVCSELRYLASSDDLWKQRYEEEFGKGMKEGQVSWKRAFSMAWGKRFRCRVGSPDWPPRQLFPPSVPLFFPGVRVDRVSQTPHGDDLGIGSPRLIRISPPCNLGGRRRQ